MIYNHFCYLKAVPRPRKLDGLTTPIKILWKDKDTMSRYKKLIKRSKGSRIEQFESDLEVFNRIINQYAKEHPLPASEEPKSTYPGIHKVNKTPISLKKITI